MNKYLVVVAVASVALTGCVHGRGEHQIPVSRDYQSLETVRVADAKFPVEGAHRVGAHHFAPYDYLSAEYYLGFAQDAQDESDIRGRNDYAALARMFADQAVKNGSGIADKGDMPIPDSKAAAQAEYDRLVARYRELDACKAKVVAPHVYAHLEANLAQAEHELNECFDYIEAWRHLRQVEPDIDAIWAKDTDGDGVVDMKDGEPWIAEDADGYQDEDGMPEPKPYPVLEDVHFDSNSATLSAQAKGYLNGVADMLLHGYKEVTVHLSAHTDSDASDEYNQELSKKRETAVMEYLVASGAQQTMLLSSHHGEAAPKAENTSEAGKAQNRRVELKLDGPDPVSPFCQN
jgi:hypothetical protein